MVRYLADTCILSVTSKPKPDRAVSEWLAGLRDELYLPMAAVIEFQLGISLKDDGDPLKMALSAWLDGLLESGMPVLPTDVATARQYGKMRACPQLKDLFLTSPRGKKVRGGQDVHLSAASIAHEMVIVTSNVKDFLLIHQRFTLPGLFDPKTGHWWVRPGDKTVYPLDPAQGHEIESRRDRGSPPWVRGFPIGVDAPGAARRRREARRRGLQFRHPA